MNNTKSLVLSVVALVVGLVALVSANAGHKTPAPADQSQSLAGVTDVHNTPSTFTDGIELGSSLQVPYSWDGCNIASKQNSCFWRNTKTATATVIYTEMATDGTASSTFKLWAYASTTPPSVARNNPAVPTNFTAADFGSLLINGKVVATTSVATTTTSDDAGVPQAGTSYQVGPGKYLNFLITGCVAGYQGGTANCDTATSSNRGFNIKARVEYHY